MSTEMPVDVGANSTAMYDGYELVCIADNSTGNGSDVGGAGELRMANIIMASFYVIICICGLIGNGLVIYVVLRFAKMKTVTNMYILNLAISDVLFLISLPFLITTALLGHFIFGNAMCKIYFVSFSINLFTSVFTLTAMSADRYLAVCHPVRSVYYRTTRIAFFVCIFIWSVSFIVMLPIILYSKLMEKPDHPGWYTCTIDWPEDQPISANKAFTWYTFLLGFLIPVTLIAVFYISVIFRLKRLGPSKRSKERKKSNRKVTRMVLAMLSVYILCWMPYWCFQGHLTFTLTEQPPPWQVFLFNFFTVLSFANSMLNPVLYAFLSEVFRKSFIKAFKCATFMDSSNKSHGTDNSVFPRSVTRKENGKDEKYEFTSVVTHTDHTVVHNTFPITAEETDTAYVDKESQTKRPENAEDEA